MRSSPQGLEVELDEVVCPHSRSAGPRRSVCGSRLPLWPCCSCSRRRGSSTTSTSTAAALPDLESFIRFEPPTIGEVYDARGKVLIELAREYRRVVSYDEVPPILRQAILAAEDKNFFSHSGVDYRALPRVVQKTAVRSLAAWWKGGPGCGCASRKGARRSRSSSSAATSSRT